MVLLAALVSSMFLQQPPADGSDIADLIRQLGDDSLEHRDAAQERLIDQGEKALPALDTARTCEDAEVANRAEAAWRIIQRRLRFASLVKDPAVRKKVDAFSTEHPGQAVLVSRSLKFVDGRFVPVRDFGASIFVKPAGGAGEEPFGVNAGPDETGLLFFAIAPGRYEVLSVGWSGKIGLNIQNAYWRWGEMFGLTFDAKEVVMLPEMQFVPRLEWEAPDDGAELSLAANPGISWKPYPEVTRVSVNVAQIVSPNCLQSLGCVGVDVTRTRCCDLERILEVHATIKPGVGARIQVSLTGYDAAGKVVTSSAMRGFVVKE